MYCLSFRLNQYEEAERHLGHAFKQPISRASRSQSEDIDPDDSALALRFVESLEQITPINIDSLRHLISRQERMISEDPGGLLDAENFLQVQRPMHHSLIQL